MKIEKINDNQIRCTLTRADLADRQLKLSELAYGTEKARSLFHDMMQQAAFEVGFERRKSSPMNFFIIKYLLSKNNTNHFEYNRDFQT